MSTAAPACVTYVFIFTLEAIIHQEIPSAVIVGCGVYNWAANCDPAVTNAIRLESVCSSAGRLRLAVTTDSGLRLTAL